MEDTLEKNLKGFLGNKKAGSLPDDADQLKKLFAGKGGMQRKGTLMVPSRGMSKKNVLDSSDK